MAADNATVSDRILKLGFDVDEQSTKAVAKQVDGLRKSLVDLESQEKKLNRTNVDLGNSYASMSAKAVQARNEILKGTKAFKDQETVLDRLRKKQAEANKPGGGGGGSGGAAPALAAAVGGSLNAAGLGELGGISTGAGQVINAFRQLQQVAGPAAEGTAGAAGSLSSLAVAGPIAVAAVVAIGIAVKDFVDKLEDGKQMISNAIDSQKTYYELVATGTKESIEAGLEELKIKQQIAAQVQRDIQAQIDAQNQQFGIFGGIVSSLGGLTDAAKENQKELDATNFQIDAYTRALGTNEVAARSAAKAQEELAETNKQKAEEASKRAAAIGEEISKLQQDSAKKEIDIREKAADQIDQINKRAAQAEADAYTNLLRDRQEADIRAGQQYEDARLAYQRDEVKGFRDHTRKLGEIRRDANRDEADLIRDRDFAGLARLRRETDQKIDDAQDQFSAERSDRLEALRQKLNDDKTGFIREREARMRAYNQQITDLRAARKREIETAAASRDNELGRLKVSLKEENAIKKAALDEALTQARNFLSQIRGMSGSSPSSGTSPDTDAPPPPASGGSGQTPQSPPRRRLAYGGYLGPGETGIINDRFPGQREKFNGTWLPPGLGAFTPLRGGQVTPGQAPGISVGDVIVSGSTWKELRARVHAEMDRKLDQALAGITG